ncbi:MAG: 50S ribosomal protein L10 [Acutalibacteraceae bacterium]|nr:50S ribosomal protein L10 [Acutalibacteraceae bacterium]
MPNAKVLEAKKQAVAELSEKISAAVTGVVVDYKGITVADDTALRKELRENGVQYFVVKNSILKRAVEGTNLADISNVCEGTTAIAIANEDYTAAARILCKFAESHDNFSVKSGFLDGEVVSVDTIEELAKLPSRDVLLATVLSAFQAPIAAFARAVQAIVDKDGEPEAAQEAAE